MADLISRAEAIDALKRDEEYDEDIPNRADGVRDAIITIMGLPSAQPKTQLSTEDTTFDTTFDCISRQAAIDAVRSYYDECYTLDDSIEELIEKLPSAQQWIPCERELPDDNREVDVTCEVKRFDGKTYRYTCRASYVHRYSIESTDYCNWEDCDEYNEEEDKYYALPGWYERVHNWDDYSYCAIEDVVVAWREAPEPWKGACS